VANSVLGFKFPVWWKVNF